MRARARWTWARPAWREPGRCFAAPDPWGRVDRLHTGCPRRDPEKRCPVSLMTPQDLSSMLNNPHCAQRPRWPRGPGSPGQCTQVGRFPWTQLGVWSAGTMDQGLIFILEASESKGRSLAERQSPGLVCELEATGPVCLWAPHLPGLCTSHRPRTDDVRLSPWVQGVRPPVL